MNQRSVNVYCDCVSVLDTEYRLNNDESPTEVIIEALAKATEIDAVDLPPLYDFVDPDALDRLFGARDGVPRVDALLIFQVDTWNVFVRGDGRIRICDDTQLCDPGPVFEPTAVG